MKLWTFQKDGFDIIAGLVDYRLSRSYKSFPQAYECLWDRVGTDQIIWCCISPDDWPMKNGYEEWELEVPVDSYLGIIDSMVWNGIIGRLGVPQKLRDSLENEYTHESYEELQRLVEEQLHSMRNPPGDPWDSLFLSEVDDLKSEVLLHCPIDPSWVVNRLSHSQEGAAYCPGECRQKWQPADAQRSGDVGTNSVSRKARGG